MARKEEEEARRAEAEAEEEYKDVVRAEHVLQKAEKVLETVQVWVLL